MGTLRLRLCFVGRHVAAVVRSAHISVRLGHGRDPWDASTHGTHRFGHIVIVGLIVLGMVAAVTLQHRSRVLVCDSALCSCQLLILYEFLLSLSMATCTT